MDLDLFNDPLGLFSQSDPLVYPYLESPFSMLPSTMHFAISLVSAWIYVLYSELSGKSLGLLIILSLEHDS